MADEDDEKTIGFHEMGLDDRLLQAIARLGWEAPTLIQEKAIPLALEGKDVLARARTGSGKTAAFAIPVIQKILEAKQVASEQATRALILTPTKELAAQAATSLASLCTSCGREVHIVDVAKQVPLATQKPLLMERPDVVVGTPSRVLAHIAAGNLTLRDSLQMVVVDEADLVFSFGYETDIKTLLSHFPRIYQALLLSATLSEDVRALKKLVLHNPVILKLQESQLPETSQLTQYHIKCEEEDKFVLLYTLLKLRLVRGKGIVFVNDVDRCFRLRLFLEQFSIPSCVLNSELPSNSRVHIVNQFNQGLYDLIIAADEVALDDPKVTKDQVKKKGKKLKKDGESGVSRGIDFQHVSNVINFDFPRDVDAYVHRVGRTARGVSTGTALSFVSIAETPLLEAVEAALAESHPDGASLFRPYEFRMEEIEGFRYRARDAMRAVTRVAIREARLKEIKAELLNSQKLSVYFNENPRDLQLLRHDRTLHTAKVHAHLKHVPDYLVPQTLRSSSAKGKGKGKANKGNYHKAPSKGQLKYKKRKADPLKSFEFGGLSKKKKK